MNTAPEVVHRGWMCRLCHRFPMKKIHFFFFLNTRPEGENWKCMPETFYIVDEPLWSFWMGQTSQQRWHIPYIELFMTDQPIWSQQRRVNKYIFTLCMSKYHFYVCKADCRDQQSNPYGKMISVWFFCLTTSPFFGWWSGLLCPALPKGLLSGLTCLTGLCVCFEEFSGFRLCKTTGVALYVHWKKIFFWNNNMFFLFLYLDISISSCG